MSDRDAMRLNLRKFHLLNKEWRYQQGLADLRAYMVVCGNAQEPDKVSTGSFPHLGEVIRIGEANRDDEDEDVAIDDAAIYDQVASTFNLRR